MLQVLKVADEMALDAWRSAAKVRSTSSGISRGNIGFGRSSFLELACLVSLMEFETLLQREFQTLEIQIAVLRCGIAAAVPHIDLLVRVQDEEVERVVPIVIEQADIDVVHARDADAHVLRQQFAAR